MAKDIGLHDFVKVKGIKGYEVVHKIDGDRVTTVSIGLSEDRDQHLIETCMASARILTAFGMKKMSAFG